MDSGSLVYEDYDSVADSGPSSIDDESTYFRMDPSINQPWSQVEKNGDIPATSSSIEKNEDSIQTGSVIGAIFNFSNGLVGAGILSFPYAMYCIGVIGGLVSILGIAFLIFFTLYVNVRCNFLKEGGFRTYQDMVRKHLNRWVMKLNEFLQFLALFGSCVAYMAIVGDFVQTFMIEIFGYGVTEYFFGDRKIITMFVGIVIMYPLCLFRETKHLSFSSLLAVLSSFYLSSFIVVMGISSIFSGNSIFNNKGEKMINSSQWVVQSKTYEKANYPLFFLGLPINLFGLTCHSLMFPVSYEIKNAGVKKTWTAIIPAFAFVILLYLLVESFGFIQFGNLVQPNVLDNYPPRNVFASIARFIIGINITLTYPVLAFPAKLVIQSLIFFAFPKYRKKRMKTNGQDGGLGSYIYLFTTTAFVLSTLVLGLFVPGIDVVFGLTGSIGCASTVFLFPSMLCFFTLAFGVYKSWNNPCRYFHIILSIVLFCSYLFFLITGCIASIFKVVTK